MFTSKLEPPFEPSVLIINLTNFLISFKINWIRGTWLFHLMVSILWTIDICENSCSTLDLSLKLGLNLFWKI
jgi:hypothetical protein